jgi:hypothetical protein
MLNTTEHDEADDTPRTPEDRELVRNLMKFVHACERNGIYARRGMWFRVRIAPRGNNAPTAAVDLDNRVFSE